MLNTSPAVGTVAADTMEVSFDGHCFGCGPLNLEGLRLTFVPGPDGSVAEFEVPDRFQSWAGMAHGGVVALMLDEAVGWAAWHAGHPGVTGRLQVSYRRPLNLGEPVRIVDRPEPSPQKTGLAPSPAARQRLRGEASTCDAHRCSRPRPARTSTTR